MRYLSILSGRYVTNGILAITLKRYWIYGKTIELVEYFNCLLFGLDLYDNFETRVVLYLKNRGLLMVYSKTMKSIVFLDPVIII